MLRGLYKLWFTVACIIVMGHNLTPHHHHGIIGAVSGQWQQDDHDDDHDEIFAALQLDHTFSSNDSFTAVAFGDVVLTEIFHWRPSIAVILASADFPAYADMPPDRQALFHIPFRGPPANLVLQQYCRA